MRQGTIVSNPSDGYAITLLAAKRQLKIEPEDTEEDDHIQSLCAAAHSHVENSLGFPILRQTRQSHFEAFPGKRFWLGGGADFEIESVKYTDPNEAEQTLAPETYRLNAIGRIAELCLAPSATWPSTTRQPSAVVVEWTAGWETASEVPDDLVHAMRLLVGHWDLNREAVAVGLISSKVQLTVDCLLDQHRTRFIA